MGDNSGFCNCCERFVDHLHWMEWGGPLSWLCSECADGAASEDEPPTDEEPSA